MTVTVVLDGRALHGWAAASPPPQLIAVMEVLRRHGSGRVVVPSVVTVEALTGDEADGPVERVLRTVELEARLSLERTRAAARLRQGLPVSAADAVVAEVALRLAADYLVTADPDDMSSLLTSGKDGAPGAGCERPRSRLPAIVTLEHTPGEDSQS